MRHRRTPLVEHSDVGGINWEKWLGVNLLYGNEAAKIKKRFDPCFTQLAPHP
jgi:hypothetical protein